MEFSARDILAKLRRGVSPSQDELNWFAKGLATDQVSDAQAGAFAMAVCSNGFDSESRVDLTLAMRDSGSILSWDFDGPVLDKHSTGGVGDCVSLILAPALAACGAFVPMISGRGLGHTGGTLDKLEAISGVRTQLDTDAFRQVVGAVGCAIVGATDEVAPADRRLYAVRDVTGTVQSIDLITASILSKKLAGGLEGLVLDIKTGSGALMKNLEEARALATSLCQTANLANCPTSALITDMSQPLATSLGNALEVAQVMRVLTQNHEGALFEICGELGGELLFQSGLSNTRQAGKEAINDAIKGGFAAEKFGKMIALMGGPIGFEDNWERSLPESPVMQQVQARKSGFVCEIDAESLGHCVVALGGGRAVESDKIDPMVGLSQVVRLGDWVEKGQPLAMVHAARTHMADAAEETVRKAITLGPKARPSPELIVDRISL